MFLFLCIHLFLRIISDSLYTQPILHSLVLTSEVGLVVDINLESCIPANFPERGLVATEIGGAKRRSGGIRNLGKSRKLCGLWK